MTDANKPTGRSRRQKPKAPTTPDPVEIAMEAEASGKAPTGEASALLRRHSALIDKQLVLASNEIFRNRIRSIRDIAIAAMVVALLVAVGHQDRLALQIMAVLSFRSGNRHEGGLVVTFAHHVGLVVAIANEGLAAIGLGLVGPIDRHPIPDQAGNPDPDYQQSPHVHAPLA